MRALKLRLLGMAVLSISLIASTASTATAAGLPNPIPCTTQTSRAVFSAFNDLRTYHLLPKGGFETGTDWTLSSGASIVSGNESYFLNSRSDAHSLRLNAGAVVTTRAFCMKPDEPVVRFLARNAGPAGGTMRVDLLYEQAGAVRTVYLATLSRSNYSWFPSPLFAVNYSEDLITKGSANVALRFTAIGGAWQIDDFYVDPFKCC